VLFPVVLACALAFARAGHAAGASAQQGEGTPPQLAPVEREVKGGESHSYGVSLSPGQFFHALVEQKGVDVEVTVYGPDGRQLSAFDSPNDLWGPEPILALAEAAGAYRVVVRAPNPKSPPGRYEIGALVLREATDADRQHAAAENLYAEGRALRLKQGAADRRASVEKFEQAIPLFRAAGEHYRAALARLSVGFVFAQLSETRTALGHFNELLSQARALGDRRLEAAAETFLGGMYELSLARPARRSNTTLARSRWPGRSATP
jgi:hypothetical protein